MLRHFRLKMEKISGIKLIFFFGISFGKRPGAAGFTKVLSHLKYCIVHTCKNISLDEKSKHGCLCPTSFISKEIKLYFNVMVRVTNKIHTYMAETFYIFILGKLCRYCDTPRIKYLSNFCTFGTTKHKACCLFNYIDACWNQ